MLRVELLNYVGYTGNKETGCQEVNCARRCCMKDFLKIVIAFGDPDGDGMGKEDDEDGD